MKKNLILTSIVAISFAMPAFAIRPAVVAQPGVGGSTTCDTSTLGQSENNSTANVEADWTANTIYINWYIDSDTQNTIARTTCTYDDTIMLPTEPTKTGYTFSGWRLRTVCETITSELECSQSSHCSWSVDLEGQGECWSIQPILD